MQTVWQITNSECFENTFLAKRIHLVFHDKINSCRAGKIELEIHESWYIIDVF